MTNLLIDVGFPATVEGACRLAGQSSVISVPAVGGSGHAHAVVACVAAPCGKSQSTLLAEQPMSHTAAACAVAARATRARASAPVSSGAKSPGAEPPAAGVGSGCELWVQSDDASAGGLMDVTVCELQMDIEVAVATLTQVALIPATTAPVAAATALAPTQLRVTRAPAPAHGSQLAARESASTSHSSGGASSSAAAIAWSVASAHPPNTLVTTLCDADLFPLSTEALDALARRTPVRALCTKYSER